MKNKDNIIIHAPADLQKMRIAGRVAAETLDYIAPFVRVGVSTGELDKLTHDFMVSKGAIPATLGYRGYPKSCCISINHIICHGIPDFDRKLLDGDILNIDVTAIVDGWYGDTSRMYYAGSPKIKAKKLVDVTYDCMMLGIEQVKPGAHLGDIGYAIQTEAHKHGYSVVDMFCGHGLGQHFHEEPQVMHCGTKGQGPVLEEGMFFTIEPMINIGKKEGIILKDGWTAATKDKTLSAQFEHSLAVTSTGYEIFTLSPKGLNRPGHDY